MQKLRLESATRLASSIPGILNIGLAIGIGLICARLFWLALEYGNDRWTPRPAPEFKVRANAPVGADVKKLTSAHLFGKPAAKGAPKPVQREKVLPKTTLNLSLVGIMAFDGGERSRALISSANRPPEPFAVGTEVPGGATVHEIQPDRVVLDRNGRFETLLLDTKKPSSPAGKNVAGARSTGRNAASYGSTSANTANTTDLGSIRQELLLDPSKASQYVRVQPARSGNQLRGYRVYPGRNRAAFKNVGLRAGDLVTAVNGVQLDDPAKSLQLLGDLSQANNVSLTVERGGKSRNVTLSID